MIVDLLKNIQKREGWNDTQMAEKMQCHRVTWNDIKNNNSPTTETFLIKARRAFPEINEEWEKYLNITT